MNNLREVTPVDHIIAQHGGTTSAMERLPHRLRQSKGAITDQSTRIVELVRENGHLLQEIALLEEERKPYSDFHQKIIEAYKILRSALHILSSRIAISEQGLLDSRGVDPQTMRKDDETLF